MNKWKFSKFKNDNVVYFKIPSFEESGLVKHCFTSRVGGVSRAPFNSLNLGTKTMDNKEAIFENYEIICRYLGINIKNVVVSDQVHEDRILIVEEEHKGSGIIHDTRLNEIDALITDKANIALVTLYADCVPLFILDKNRKIIALAHGGWRGTVKKIGKKVICRMKSEFGTDPKDCIVGIGPSIGKCCYEVDDYVISQFKESFESIEDFTEKKDNGRYLLDLWNANKISLIEAGVPCENITVSNICTKCNNDIFFSYRAEKGLTGRMAAIMELI